MLNTEYVIIPVCLPDNDIDYIGVCGFPFRIYSRDDETGRLIDTMQAEQDAMSTAKDVYHWTGKLDFAYGIGTAGGIGNRAAADKANERIISRLIQCNRRDFIQGKY